MIRWQPALRSTQDVIGGPALHRLKSLMPVALHRFERHAGDGRIVPRHYRARRDILPAGQAQAEPAIVVDGWVCHHRLLQDGRRQIVALTLPGELLLPDMRVANDGVGALTDVMLIDGPTPDGDHDPVAAVYVQNARLQQAYLLDHIVRLGRQVAFERMAHLLLELHGRLTLSGLAEADSYPMPLTQEGLADLLGLTSVHVNRTLQMLKRERLIDSRRGWITLLDRAALVRLADFHPPAAYTEPPAAGDQARADTIPRAIAVPLPCPT